MDQLEFINQFTNIINLVAESIENQDPEGSIDVDIKGDILNIETKDGIFVINKQTSMQEIWLSSPISGPHHFHYEDGEWKNRKGTAIFEILSAELGITLL